MEEIWKDIVGYEGKYQVSNFGNVKHIWKTKEKLLKPCADRCGYLLVDLCIDSKYKRRTIHSLVLEAFVGPRPEGMEICHNDGNRQNNHLDNLRYDTHRNNIIDSVKQGTVNTQKLCEHDVMEIRKLLKESNLTLTAIAKMYNVSIANIHYIKTHKNWEWLNN